MDTELAYSTRLERLKVYIEGFVFDQPYKRKVNYGFKKLEHPYTNDSMQVVPDPLEWVLIEYNLLGKDWYLEIQFKYYNDEAKKFVLDWMEKNIKWAERI